MYHAPNFSAQELVPTKVYSRFGKTAYRFINPLLALSMQQLRNKFGRIIVNVPNQNLEQRGLRTSEFYDGDLQKFDRYFSMHKFGCAVDSTPLDTPLEEIIEYIKQNPDEFPFISFVEVDRSWLHIDVRNQENITFWSPERGVVFIAKQKPINWSRITPHLETGDDNGLDH